MNGQDLPISSSNSEKSAQLASEREGSGLPIRRVRYRRQMLIASVLVGILALSLQLAGFFQQNMQVWYWPSSIVCGIFAIWLFGSAQFSYASGREVALVRLDGAGDANSHERERWIRVQTQRAHWIASLLILVTWMALSVYIGNHLVIRPSTSGTVMEPTYQPYWQLYTDVKEVYETQLGDTLASSASNLGTTVTWLATTNPTVMISLTTDIANMTSMQGIGTNINLATLESLAQVVHQDVERIAPLYSTNAVIPGQVLRLPSATPRHWADWMLWCIIGIAVSLLLKVSSDYGGIAAGETNYLNSTPWYWAQFMTGPMIAFILLLFLTRVNVEIVGADGQPVIAIDLGQLPANLLFIVAFILGFFGRLAIKLLEQIAKSLFRSAYSSAYGDFKIAIKDRPYSKIIESNERLVFEPSPNVGPVRWQAEGGHFNGDAYTAPNVADDPVSVVVSAFPIDGSGTMVTSEFVVVPDRFTVVVNGSHTLAVGDSRQLIFRSSHANLPTGTNDMPHWSLAGIVNTDAIELDTKDGWAATLNVHKMPLPDRVRVNTMYKGYAVTTVLTVINN